MPHPTAPQDVTRYTVLRRFHAKVRGHGLIYFTPRVNADLIAKLSASQRERFRAAGAIAQADHTAPASGANNSEV